MGELRGRGEQHAPRQAERGIRRSAPRALRPAERVAGRPAERGFVLLDVLAALAISLIGLSVFFGGLAGVARLVARQEQRVRVTIEQRNSDAKQQAITIQGK